MSHDLFVAAFEEKGSYQEPEQAEEAENGAQERAVVTADLEEVHTDRGEDLTGAPSSGKLRAIDRFLPILPSKEDLMLPVNPEAIGLFGLFATVICFGLEQVHAVLEGPDGETDAQDQAAEEEVSHDLFVCNLAIGVISLFLLFPALFL